MTVDALFFEKRMQTEERLIAQNEAQREAALTSMRRRNRATYILEKIAEAEECLDRMEAAGMLEGMNPEEALEGQAPNGARRL
jgi:hypothetical protein